MSWSCFNLMMIIKLFFTQCLVLWRFVFYSFHANNAAMNWVKLHFALLLINLTIIWLKHLYEISKLWFHFMHEDRKRDFSPEVSPLYFFFSIHFLTCTLCSSWNSPHVPKGTTVVMVTGWQIQTFTKSGPSCHQAAVYTVQLHTVKQSLFNKDRL